MAKKERYYVKEVYDSPRIIKITKELLEAIKKNQKLNQIKKEINIPPKWLLGRETLYNPAEDNDK